MPSLRPDRSDSSDDGSLHQKTLAWKRLEVLVDRVEKKGPASLGDADLGELGRLYRAAATSLARARSLGASVARMEYLNHLVIRGHGALYGRPRKGSNVRLILWSPLVFPEVIRKTWRYHLVAALLMVLAGVYGYRGTLADPEWSLNVIPPMDNRTPFASPEELRETLLAGRPGHPYLEDGDREIGMGGGVKAHFATYLWAHNTRVGLLAFFAGFLGGILTVILDLYNGLFLGVYSATFISKGLAYPWWAWVLPHGITELLAVVLLSGGGLWIGHRMIAPGKVSRIEALREIRGGAIHILMFAFPMFFIAALLESFLRQSGLSDDGRYVFAALSAIAWIVYLTWGKVPAGVRETIRSEMTPAETWAIPPSDEDLLDALSVAMATRGRPGGGPPGTSR